MGHPDVELAGNSRVDDASRTSGLYGRKPWQLGRDTVNSIERNERARRALQGYVNGPDACTEATARALTKVDAAASLVLVEGISDQIAVETAAVGLGRDLEAEGVVV